MEYFKPKIDLNIVIWLMATKSVLDAIYRYTPIIFLRLHRLLCTVRMIPTALLDLQSLNILTEINLYRSAFGGELWALSPNSSYSNGA